MINLILIALMTIPPLPVGPLYTELFTPVASVMVSADDLVFVISDTAALYTTSTSLHINDYSNGNTAEIVIAMNGRVESTGGLTNSDALRVLASNFMRYYSQQRQVQEELHLEQQERHQTFYNHYEFTKSPAQVARPDNALDHQASLTWAMQVWERALGVRLWIARPSLQTGGRGSSGALDTIACALTIHDRPVIVFEDREPLDYPGYRTILLREIGHLLGVPHIQDDALMNDSYGGKPLDRPTRAAVALAGLAIPEEITRK